MADTTVDSILIEIEAPADKAKGGLQQIKKSLESMKDATKGIDIEKLRQTASAIEQISKAGEGAKSAGQGIKSIVSSIKSLEGISSNRLKKVADAIQKISTSLGNMGNNNKINISIDSDGISKSIKPIEDMANSPAMQNMKRSVDSASDALDRLNQKQSTSAQSADANASAMSREGSAAQSATSGVNTLLNVEDRAAQSANNAASAQRNFDNSLRNKSGANTATAKIQDLINKINQYKASIAEMESGKKLFNAEEYEEAVQGLEKAKNAFEQYKETVQNSPKSIDDVAKSFKKVRQAAQNSGLSGFGNALQNIAAMLPMIQLGGVEASAGFQAMAVGLEALQTAIPIIGLILTAITAIVNAIRGVSNAIKTTVQNAVGRVKAGISAIRTALAKMKSWLGGFFKNIKDNLGIQDRSIGDLGKKLRSFMRLFTFMALRKVLTALFMNIGSSFEALAQYSDMIGSKFNKNVSLIVSDMKWLSNSMIAAFEPILNVITPIIDFLISKLVTAINAINQFFAALSGAKTWTKAKRNVKNYAAGLDKGTGAAKKMKKAIDDLTTGIDELNILRQDNGDDGAGGGGGGGGTNPAEDFTTEQVNEKWKNLADWIKDLWNNGADFTELGKMLGDKLAEMLANIPWDKIKENARKLGKALATLINGFLQGEFDGKSVSWWIGHTIAEAINTAFEFINSFVSNLDWSALGKAFTDLIKGVLESLDWPLIYDTITKIGKGIADFFNAIFRDKKMWEEVGDAFAKAVNTIVHGAYTFITTFDWSAFGTAIATGLGTALTKISYKQIGLTLANGINGAFQALYSFATTFPWHDVAYKFAQGINTALENLDWGTIKSGFTAFCKGVGDNLNTAITTINWGLVGKTLGNSINTLISGIGEFVGQIDFKKIGNDIADFINNAVETIDWKNAGETINSIVNGICDLIDTVIQKVDWNAILKGVGVAMSKVDWDRILATTFEVFAKKWTFEKMFKGVVWGDIAISILGGIGKAINDTFSSIGDTIWSAIKKALGIDNGSSSEGESIGGDIIGGILKGIIIPQPLQAFLDFIQAVKDIFGIASPSKVFEEIGGYLIDGLWEGISGAWTTFWDNLGKKFDELKQGFSDTWDNIKTGTKTSWENVKTNISEKFTAAKEKASTTAGALKDKVETTWNTVKEKTGATWQNVKDTVSEKFDATKEKATTTATNLKDKVNTTWDNLKTKTANTYQSIKQDTDAKFIALKTALTVTANNLKQTLSQRWDEIKSKASTAWQNVKTDVSGKFEALKTALTTTANNIKSTLEQRWGEIKIKAANDWQSLKTDVSGKFENLKTSLTTTSNNIKSTLSSAWDSVKSTASTKWGQLKTDVTNLYTGLKTTLEGVSFTSVGTNIINGIWNGVKDKWDWLKQKVKDVADSLLDAAKDALGIESPSKEFAEIGEYVVSGMEKGLDTYKSIEKTVTSFASAVISWFKGSGSNEITTQFKTIASDVVSGFKSKISSDYTTTQSPMTTWAENVRAWFNNGSFGGVNTKSWTDYASNVIEGFRDRITNYHSQTQNPIITWATNLKTWFNNGSFGAINTAKWTSYANEVITGFKDKITNGHGATQSPIVTWATNLKTWFNSSSFGAINNAKWTSYALETINGFKDKITNGHSATQSPITTWASNLKNWFSGSGQGAINNATWTKFAGDVIDGFKDKITNGHSAAQQPMKTFANNVKSWFETPGQKSLVSMFKDIGANIVQGFIDGVSSLWDTAMRKIREFGEAVVAAGKEGTEESSPSRAFRQIGGFVVEGFNLGIDDEMASTYKIMSEWLSGINSQFTVSPQLQVDTSALQNYSANYGAEFTDAAITHKVQKQLDLDSSIQTELDGSRFTEGVRRVISEELTPYLSDIRADAKRQADKKEQTVVEIGRRTITDAVTRQKAADGFSFTPSYA